MASILAAAPQLLAGTLIDSPAFYEQRLGFSVVGDLFAQKRTGTVVDACK